MIAELDSAPAPSQWEFDTGIHEGIQPSIYHAADGVSNSDLKLFSEEPRIYYNARIERISEDDSDLTEDERKSRVMGRLLHLAILEPDKFGFAASHFTKPAGMTFTTKEGKAWRDEHQHLPIISAIEDRRIAGARNAVLSHPVAGPLFRGAGQHEASVFATHPKTGLRLRMRGDRLTEDADDRPWCIDLKSVPDVDAFVRSARQFRYDIQDCHYTTTLELAGVPNVIFCFVCVELKPRYGVHPVRVVCMDEETKAAARELWERDLEQFAACKAANAWPVKGTEIELVRVKRWNQ